MVVPLLGFLFLVFIIGRVAPFALGWGGLFRGVFFFPWAFSTFGAPSVVLRSLRSLPPRHDVVSRQLC